MTATNKATYGLQLTGVVRVFRKDKEIEDTVKKVKFTVSDVWFNVSEKDEKDNWFNVSSNLIFKRGIEPPANNSVIEIIEAFPMVTGKGKYRKLVYYVKGWHYAEGYEVDEGKKVGKGLSFAQAQAHLNGVIDLANITDDDLPF